MGGGDNLGALQRRRIPAAPLVLPRCDGWIAGCPVPMATGPASPDLREGDPGPVDLGVAGTIRTPAEPLPAVSMTLDVRRVC
jgi:hypothetical protein